MFKYYKWCLHYWIYTNVSYIIEKIIIILTNMSSPPSTTYPMKYNQKTEDFDSFYTWSEIKQITKILKKGVKND